MTATNTLLDVRDLGRRTSDEAGWLVHQISFQVNARDRLAILGPSGAGKTVLLRLLAMLDSPDQGEILLRGRCIDDADVPVFRGQVIYLHQRPYLLDGTVQHNLELPFKLKAHQRRGFDRDRVMEALDRLGKSEMFLGRSTQDLSGGETQIVALLRAMQLDPLILLLDEPTASADPETALAIEQLVMEWYEADPQRALVCVTHQSDQVKRWTRRSLRLEKGKLIGNCDGE